MVELVTDDDRTTELSKDDVKKLWALIDTSKKKDTAFFKLCKDLRILYKTGMIHELDGMDEADRVVVNLAHAHIASILPTVFFKEPTVKAMPTAPHHEGKEKTWEALLNNTNNKIGFKVEAKKAVKDALVYPEGWLKVLSNKPVGTQGEGDETATDKETETTETGKRGPTPWMSQGTPVFARASALQTIVDYRSVDRSTDNARFVTFVYAKDLDELRADSRYKIPKDLNMKGVFGGVEGGKLSISNGWIDPFVQEGEFGEEIAASDQDQYVFVYETWVYQLVGMKLKRQLVVLLAGKDGLLSDVPIRLDTWENVLGQHVIDYPFERLVFHDIPDSLPNSELGVWSSIHGAINWLTSRLVSLVEAEKPLYEFDPNQTEDKEAFKAQFQRSKGTRTLLEVKDLGKTIAGIPNQTTPRDNYQLLNVLQEVARRVGGVSENRQGGGNFRTATESSNVEQGQQIKTHEKVDRVADWLRALVIKEISIIRSLVSESNSTEFVFNVGGDTGAVRWLNFTDNDINWIPEITIVVNSFSKATREEDVQKAAMALQQGANIFQFVPSIRLDILYKNLLVALEVSGVGAIVDSKQDQGLLQAVELVMLLQGQDMPIDASHDHAAHVEVIQMFLNAPGIETIMQANPEGVEKVARHMEEHLGLLEQAQGAAQGRASNPYDTGINQQSPANQARQDTAIDREAVGPIPGSGGQR